MDCIDCGEKISEIRLEANPDTDYCVGCVDKHIPKVRGYMIYGHKTAGEIVIAKGKENIRRLEREYHRSR